jgi:hypothetical protein
METAMGSAEGVQRIVGAGFKSPMDFTMNLSKGFRNAPKLYGDDSVRKPEKVTDFKSGIRAAGREFGFGMYDGITGLVTQPMKGAQKEGAAGFFKGIGKGIGGIALKPGAAVFGIPGYTMQGVYKEMQKQMGSSVQNYIIAARTAQGYEEWSGASAEERSDVVRRWQILETQLRKKRNADDVVKEIFEEARRKRMESLPAGEQSAGSSNNQPTGQRAQQAPDPGALEAAIRESIRQTSRGNPEEDAAIERAIRVSMSELARNSGAAKPQDDDDEALRKAMAASTQDSGQQTGQQSEHDEELERALANSLKEQRRQYDNDHNDDDDNDEEYQRALRESQQAASNAGEGSSSAPAYDQGHLGGTTREQYEQSGAGKNEKSQEEQDEERIVLAYVKKQSMLEQQHQSGKKGEGSSSAGAGGNHNDDNDDEELRKAMEESLKST